MSFNTLALIFQEEGLENVLLIVSILSISVLLVLKTCSIDLFFGGLFLGILPCCLAWSTRVPKGVVSPKFVTGAVILLWEEFFLRLALIRLTISSREVSALKVILSEFDIIRENKVMLM